MISWNSLSYKECIDLLDSNKTLRHNMTAISIAHEFEFVIANSILNNNLDDSLDEYLTEDEKGEIFRDIVEEYLNLSDDYSYYIVVKDVITKWINNVMGKNEINEFCDYDNAYEEYIKFKKGEA